MPNAIKYSTSAQTLALKKGNLWIGTGDAGKGPSSTTGYYNGVTPAAGGYTIYSYSATQTGNLSYFSAANDAALIAETNRIAGTSYTTAAQCLDYFSTQTDKMVFNIDCPAIITNGLVLNVDAGFTPSYPTTGTTWYDVGPNSYNGALTNGPTYNSSNNGNIVFDGIDDKIIGTSFVANITDKTLQGWVKLTSTTQQGGGLINIQGVSGQPSPYSGVEGEPFDSIVYNETNQGWGFGSTNFNRTAWSGVKETSTNDWVFMCATYANNNYNLYRNGSLILNTTSFQAYSYNFTCRVQIGERHTGGGGVYLSASIASGALYNRALSSAEVLQNFNATKSRFGL